MLRFSNAAVPEGKRAVGGDQADRDLVAEAGEQMRAVTLRTKAGALSGTSGGISDQCWWRAAGTFDFVQSRHGAIDRGEVPVDRPPGPFRRKFS